MRRISVIATSVANAALVIALVIAWGTPSLPTMIVSQALAQTMR